MEYRYVIIVYDDMVDLQRGGSGVPLEFMTEDEAQKFGEENFPHTRWAVVSFQ